MPSIRTLDREPVEEEVSSRVPARAMPSAPVDFDLTEVKAARERVEQRKAREPRAARDVTHELRVPIAVQTDWVPDTRDDRVVPPAVPLPADFESGLKNLEATLAQISKAAQRMLEGADLARQQMVILRQRAEHDQAALAKLAEIQKALGG